MNTVDRKRYVNELVMRFFETKPALFTRYLPRCSCCWTDNRRVPVNACGLWCQQVGVTKVLEGFLLEAIVNADEQLHVTQSL